MGAGVGWGWGGWMGVLHICTVLSEFDTWYKYTHTYLTHITHMLFLSVCLFSHSLFLSLLGAECGQCRWVCQKQTRQTELSLAGSLESVCLRRRGSWFQAEGDGFSHGFFRWLDFLWNIFQPQVFSHGAVVERHTAVSFLWLDFLWNIFQPQVFSHGAVVERHTAVSFLWLDFLWNIFQAKVFSHGAVVERHTAVSFLWLDFLWNIFQPQVFSHGAVVERHTAVSFLWLDFLWNLFQPKVFSHGAVVERHTAVSFLWLDFLWNLFQPQVFSHGAVVERHTAVSFLWLDFLWNLFQPQVSSCAPAMERHEAVQTTNQQLCMVLFVCHAGNSWLWCCWSALNGLCMYLCMLGLSLAEVCGSYKSDGKRNWLYRNSPSSVLLLSLFLGLVV